MPNRFFQGAKSFAGGIFPFAPPWLRAWFESSQKAEPVRLIPRKFTAN